MSMSITATRTIGDLATETGVTILTGHAPDFEIPVLTGPQRQGDVLVLPDCKAAAAAAVPRTGTPVVRGENGGNTHAIYADGPGVLCDTYPADAQDLRVATLLVPEGTVAYLGHPEHAFAGIGPGSYTIRRQREQADELRIVCD